MTDDANTSATPGSVAVVVPVKSFELAKTRLADSLPAADRRSLAREMATSVVTAARPLPTWVVCHDHDIARWAMDLGAHVYWRSQTGLTESVSAAVEALAGIGVATVIVAHGDLPLARSLAWVADHDGVTIVRDRRGEGTNVLAVPTGVGFRFAYGEGSAERHAAEAERLGLPVRLIDDEALGWDVDVADDLAVFTADDDGKLTLR
ncbi:MAG: 2-phospho-L-lactate guanylyltransferase [Actinomycetota bacterium]